MTDYAAYRKAKIESGALYQDFVVDLAWQTIGLAIVQYASRAYQATVGESRTGVEIKHDEKMKATGNLWIEVAEKGVPREGPYARSGIYRDDNTWLYAIGDYDIVFFFSKKLLQHLHQNNKYRVLPNKTATSQGFLLPVKDAEWYAAVTLRPGHEGRITQHVGNLEALGRELHRAVLEDSRQLKLF